MDKVYLRYIALHLLVNSPEFRDYNQSVQARVRRMIRKLADQIAAEES